MFDRYTDEQWEAIVVARADWPPGIDWAEIRSEIERAGRGFWSARELRRGYLPDELQRIRHVIKDMKKLESDLSQLDIPVVKSMITNRAGDMEAKLKSLRRDLQRLDLDGSEAFRGRADAHREILYFLMLRLWTGKLGGELKFSRDPNSKVVGGPLVRFLTAVLEPILGPETPGSEGIAAIIGKERKHPAHFQQVIARAAASWDQRYRD
jgi:hypothetical protein